MTLIARGIEGDVNKVVCLAVNILLEKNKGEEMQHNIKEDKAAGQKGSINQSISCHICSAVKNYLSPSWFLFFFFFCMFVTLKCFRSSNRFKYWSKVKLL